MKIIPLLLLTFSAIADCRVMVTAGITTDFNSGDVAGSDTLGNILMISCDKPLADNYGIFGGWIHSSFLFRGEPFNDRKETHIDHFGIGIYYEWQ